MSYKLPSRRLRKRNDDKLNLIPILDSVFIFIFFLLMSAQFVKIFEISSDIPIISNSPPPKELKPPLALTLRIEKDNLILLSGVPSQVIKQIPMNNKSYDLVTLHQEIINIKKRYLEEDTIVLEPSKEVSYEDIVKIMDEVRTLRKSDESLYTKDKQGNDSKIETLFDKILFGNLMS
jgi:biopolymer transport protein ExbD